MIRYGEDALDVTKSSQLYNFKLLADNYKCMLDRLCAHRITDAFEGKVCNFWVFDSVMLLQ